MAIPATAQNSFGPDAGRPDAQDIEEGTELMREGARRLLEGLIGELDPRMEGLAETLRDWDLDDFGIEDLGAYEAPERLPNGDIIIRRKDPNEGDTGDTSQMDDEIEI